MEKTNKKLPVIIAAVTIVVFCIGIAYAYFIYTKDKILTEVGKIND